MAQATAFDAARTNLNCWTEEDREAKGAAVGTFEDTSRSCAMHGDKLYDEATEVMAEDGEVILDGPDAVDVKITPEAAEETADRLIKGAAEAAGQRRLKNQPHRPQK